VRRAATLPKKLAADLGKYALDPNGWVFYAFGWGKGELAGSDGPDAWQKKFLAGIGEKLREATSRGIDAGSIIREAAASGHGIGKSALVAWLILWAMSTFPDTRGVVPALLVCK